MNKIGSIYTDKPANWQLNLTLKLAGQHFSLHLKEAGLGTEDALWQRKLWLLKPWPHSNYTSQNMTSNTTQGNASSKYEHFFLTIMVYNKSSSIADTFVGKHTGFLEHNIVYHCFLLGYFCLPSLVHSSEISSRIHCHIIGPLQIAKW